MRKFIPKKWDLFLSIGLIALLIILLLAVPSEKTLGNIIKVVYLHAALVQTGLLLFALAAFLGLWYLFQKKQKIIKYCEAVQETTLLVWVLYALSSMWVTFLAWGKLIAWDEPRVRSSAMILFFAVLVFLVTRWVKSDLFTAITNLMTGIFVWIITKAAGIIQHPKDPIGSSNASSLRWLFMATFFITLLISILIVRWIVSGKLIQIDKSNLED